VVHRLVPDSLSCTAVRNYLPGIAIEEQKKNHFSRAFCDELVVVALLRPNLNYHRCHLSKWFFLSSFHRVLQPFDKTKIARPADWIGFSAALP
jgi:hypothetical protein